MMESVEIRFCWSLSSRDCPAGSIKEHSRSFLRGVPQNHEDSCTCGLQCFAFVPCINSTERLEAVVIPLHLVHPVSNMPTPSYCKRNIAPFVPTPTHYKRSILPNPPKKGGRPSTARAKTVIPSTTGAVGPSSNPHASIISAQPNDKKRKRKITKRVQKKRRALSEEAERAGRPVLMSTRVSIIIMTN